MTAANQSHPEGDQVQGYTSGPWLLAAKPSSIVGWPIVAPQAQGRLVCSINYADKAAFGGPQSGDRAFNAESEANGRLIEAAPELLAELCRARAAIASLDEFDLGGVDVLDPETGECVDQYGILDELLAGMDAAIAKARGQAVSK